MDPYGRPLPCFSRVSLIFFKNLIHSTFKLYF
jgi:hypothetical protein